MTRRPAKYKARTEAPRQADMFGGQPPPPPRRDPYPCAIAMCGRHGGYGYALRGRGAVMAKYFCEEHRAHGEAHFREVNK